MAEPPMVPIDSKYSDLTIICDGRHFRVHKVIVCTASPVLAAACDHDMREARTGILEHKEFDAATVERMISYIYKKSYSITPTESSQAHGVTSGSNQRTITAIVVETATEDLPVLEELLLSPKQQAKARNHTRVIEHARVYAIAEYYDIAALKEEALYAFRDAFAELCRVIDAATLADVVQEVCMLSPQGGALRNMLLSVMTMCKDVATSLRFTTALSELDGLQGFTAQLLYMTADWLEFQKGTYMDDVAELKAQIVGLKQGALDATAKTNAAEEREKHTQGVMDRLVSILQNMGQECPNHGCPMRYQSLVLERCGLDGQGDWQLRCGRQGCRARLR